ncbi:MAG: phosphotransferase, partial [Pirellulaceae bacterium]
MLNLPLGCLVHKDLALWNILGTRDQIAAFIDFDDAISGDSM